MKWKIIRKIVVLAYFHLFADMYNGVYRLFQDAMLLLGAVVITES